jgi:hypothetical protein
MENLIHQMYIAYYQRPADPEGMAYWLDQIERAGSWEAVSAAFGAPENPEYQGLYGGKNRSDLVKTLYASAFGREAVDEEVSYWAASPHSDMNLAFAIINGAQNADLAVVDKKVQFADEVLNRVGNNAHYAALGDSRGLLARIDATSDVSAAAVSALLDQYEDSSAVEVPEPDEAEPERNEDDEGALPEAQEQNITLSLQADGWDASSNRLSLSLEFDSALTFEGFSLQGSGSLSQSVTTSTIDDLTTVSATLYAVNGSPEGVIEIELVVPADYNSPVPLTIRDFTINRIEYPDVTHELAADNLISFHYADLLGDFSVATESLAVDTSGYDTFYSHINEVLTLPGTQIGLIESDTPTSAFLHIDAGERFAFDHDSFIVRTDTSTDYRLKVTPEDPSVFTSNVIAQLFSPDGASEGLLMNLIGSQDTLYEGAFYSGIFTLEENQDHFITLSMRWSDDYPAVASGPVPYDIELIAVIDPLNTGF